MSGILKFGSAQLGTTLLPKFDNFYDKDTTTGKSIYGKAGDKSTRKVLAQDLFRGYRTDREYAQNVMREFGITKAREDIQKILNIINKPDVEAYVATHFNFIEERISKTFDIFYTTAKAYIDDGDTFSDAVRKTFDEIEFLIIDARDSAEKYYPLKIIEARGKDAGFVIDT